MQERFPIVARYSAGVCVLVFVCGGAVSRGQQATPTPIVDRVPFDRITLDDANQNAIIDVQLLDLPDRKVPQPLPTTGSLSLRRLSDPSTLYEVAWSNVAKVELYEQLVLQEAAQSVADGQLADAFRNLSFLHENYPDLAGLGDLTQEYLQRDAKEAFDKQRYDESLAILAALHELNPQRPGIARAVEGVSDRLINKRLADRDFEGARGLLESLSQLFPQLELTNINAWQEKFAVGAERQLDVAREAIGQGDYSAARQAIQRALAILPDVPGANDLLAELKRRAPEIVVGVAQAPALSRPESVATWANERVGRLTNPQFVELVRVGSEGGEYSCRWADIKADESGLRMELKFNDAARRARISPDRVALQLVRMADKQTPQYRVDFARAFATAEIIDGQSLLITWRYAHVKPEALLQFPLADLYPGDMDEIAYSPTSGSDLPTSTVYRPGAESAAPAIREVTITDDSQAVEALRRGDLDVLDQVPPWQLARVKQDARATIGTYRLPTVHVLLCNYSNPLLSRREFRRALCYAIDRPRLVAEILAGKDATPGFRVLSGPLLAGVKVNDVLGYAYKQDLQPLPYEPRLAVVLATSARTTVAKQALIHAGQDDPKVEELPKPDPLILAHPPDAISRTMCGLIKKQLDAVGIPIDLTEEVEPEKWDLRYAELCMWEPVVDARKLLGPAGLAGRCSPAMNMALRELDKVTNWSDARVRLQRIHQLAFDDLPVIPLWQTINYFAYRDSVVGVTRDPVSLYQDVANWTISYGLAGSRQ